MASTVSMLHGVVIPAKAGIHVGLSFVAQMDPGLRRDDGGVLT